MVKSLKLATPPEAFFVVVPLNVPPPGLLPSAIVMAAVDEVTVLLKLSCTVTVGGPGILLPALAFPGCAVKASFAAAPGLILKAALVAPVSPVEETVRVYPFPTLSRLRSLKLATPETAFLVKVPLSAPPPGFAPIATVIEAVEVVTTLPKLSCTATVKGPGIAAPAAALVGWVVIARLLAGSANWTTCQLTVLLAPLAPRCSLKLVGVVSSPVHETSSRELIALEAPP